MKKILSICCMFSLMIAPWISTVTDRFNYKSSSLVLSNNSNSSWLFAGNDKSNKEVSGILYDFPEQRTRPIISYIKEDCFSQDRGLQRYFELAASSLEKEEWDVAANQYSAIANHYKYFKNLEKANRYYALAAENFEKAAPLATVRGFSEYASAAGCYEELGNLVKAKECYQKAWNKLSLDDGFLFKGNLVKYEKDIKRIEKKQRELLAALAYSLNFEDNFPADLLETVNGFWIGN